MFISYFTKMPQSGSKFLVEEILGALDFGDQDLGPSGPSPDLGLL
jgi:hypothetical protein